MVPAHTWPSKFVQTWADFCIYAGSSYSGHYAESESGHRSLLSSEAHIISWNLVPLGFFVT